MLLATVSTVLVTVSARARAQSVVGALGVSATILPPDGAQPPQLVSMSLARTGIAHLETSAPVAGAVSQIVMVTVSSPTNRFAPMAQPPTLVTAKRDTEELGEAPNAPDAASARRRYDVKLDTAAVGAGTDTVSVRIHYLIVPGT